MSSERKLYVLLAIGLFLMVAVPIFYRLSSLFEVNPTLFWREAPFYISSIAVVFAGYSVFIASRSLQLTRAANRPFVSCTGLITEHKQGKNLVLAFPIQNSGSLPADDVYVEIDPFHISEQVAEHNQGNSYTRPQRDRQTAIIFPKLEHEELFRLDLADTSDHQLWLDIQSGVVLFRLRINYKNMGVDSVTIQTMTVQKVAGRGIVVVPRYPQKWT